MKGISKSVFYLKPLIEKFNKNGDYHIGDELSWALDGVEAAEKEISRLKAANEVLMEMCEFYGDYQNWYDSLGSRYENIITGDDMEEDPIIQTGGKRARLAKKKVEEIMGDGE